MVYVYISLPYLFRWFFLFQSCLFLGSVLTCSLLNTGFFLAQSSPISPTIISSANIHNFLYLCNTSFQKCICLSKNRLKHGICHTLCLPLPDCQILNCQIVRFVCCSLCVLLADFWFAEGFVIICSMYSPCCYVAITCLSLSGDYRVIIGWLSGDSYVIRMLSIIYHAVFVLFSNYQLASKTGW